jgi:hypothetical protein
MRRRAQAAACLALFLSVLAAAPAGADTRAFEDARGDVAHYDADTDTWREGSSGIDMYRVRVTYDDRRLVVRTRFRDLNERNVDDLENARHTIWINTNRARDGHEYRLRHVQLGLRLDRMRGYDEVREDVPCRGMRWSANKRTDISRLVVPRGCFRRGERGQAAVLVEAIRVDPRSEGYFDTHQEWARTRFVPYA